MLGPPTEAARAEPTATVVGLLAGPDRLAIPAAAVLGARGPAELAQRADGVHRRGWLGSLPRCGPHCRVVVDGTSAHGGART